MALVAVKTRRLQPKEARLWSEFERNNLSRGPCIGKGGEGSVYLCTETCTRERMVVKCTRYPYMLHGKMKEEQILYDHLQARPYLVGFHKSFYDPMSGAGLLVLEYCDGNSLANLIGNYEDRGAMIPEPFVWHVFQGMIHALKYIHSNGIFHRDMKPDNILLNWHDATWGIRRWQNAYPIVKLADFGLAGARSDPKWSSHCFYGTPAYQPPEIPLATGPGDLWGLGATIHELMHFQLPLPDGHSRWDRRAKLKCHPMGDKREPYIVRSRGYGKTLHTFVRRVLAWFPEDRPTASHLSRLIEAERPYPVDKDFRALPRWATENISQSSWPERIGKYVPRYY